MAGDFNFVEHKNDRICASTAEATGGKDWEEKKAAKTEWNFKKGMIDWQQEEMTFSGGKGRSRIDRIYSNHHITDQ